MGFRAIERVKGVDHTTVITWVKKVAELLPNAYEPEEIPQVRELNELETFVGCKKAARPTACQASKVLLRRTMARIVPSAERRKGASAVYP